MNNPRLVTALIARAACAQDILAVVRDNLHELNHFHVGTSFNRFGKMARDKDFSPRNLTGDDTFRELLRLTCGLAKSSEFGSQSTANTTYGIAKLHQAGRVAATDGIVDDTLAALEIAAGRAAQDMQPQHVANLTWAYATLGRMPGDSTWAALETAARRVARDMKPQDVANLTWAYAKFGRMPGDNTWAALETAMRRVARDMNSQDVANLTWAYAKFGRMPDNKTWAALETAAGRVAQDMSSQHVANMTWAYATLGRMPGDRTWAALETAAGQVARDMQPQDVANLTWAHAKLGWMPGDNTWAALETAARRVARDMQPRHVANLTWAYAKFGRMPGDSTWAALETAAGRVVRDMQPQDVANLTLAYAKAGRIPGDNTWAALTYAAGRVARDMESQDVVNLLYAYTILFILQHVEYPSCYAVVWDQVSSLKLRDFSREALLMLYHVHLMHSLSGSNGPATVQYPAWLMVEARDEWIREVRDDSTVSIGHRELASVFDKLGIRYEIEHVTADGCFSMDIYLPVQDVAVEFDGPTHYYRKIEDSSSSQDVRLTRTIKTKLRDFLLAKQCAKVVTVPYFQWGALNSLEERKAYVEDKLAKEAGIEV
jgi:peptidoglycan hydrolase-like protein with peptidoglycan-binding domain